MWMCYLQIVIYLFILFIYFSLDLLYLCSEKTDVRQPWTLKSWGGKLTLSTQLIKPKFMLRTLADTTPTFIRNWTFNSGGSTRSSTHPGPKAMFTLITLVLTRKFLTVGKQDAKCGHLGTNSQFLSVWVQSLRDGWTLYSKQSYGFWRENDVTRLTAKFYFNWWRNK